MTTFRIFPKKRREFIKFNLKRDFGPYTPPMPVAPPPVKGFKMEADREFGNFVSLG